MAFADLPIVDFEALLDPSNLAASQTLGASLERFGFVAINNHRISEELLAAAYGASRDVFALPSEAKRAYEDADGNRQRGYTSYGVERAAQSDVGDLKEFWHVGRSSPPQPKQLKNRFPHEVPAFEEHLSEIFAAFETHAKVVLGAIEQHLGCSPGRLTDMVAGGNSVVRVIHYPPLAPNTPKGALRASEHEDINLITLLVIPHGLYGISVAPVVGK